MNFRIISKWAPVVFIIGLLGYEIYKSRKRKIFVSYHSRKDSKYKNLLMAWQKNKNFKFEFHDKSVGVSIKSINESKIKAGITTKLKESNLILCIVGEETHIRPMVNWELEKAKKLEKKILVVKTSTRFKTPECLLGSKTMILNRFQKETILNAIYKS